jgi:hypothetical protein
MRPTQTKTTVLRQIVTLIPGHLVTKLAEKHGVDKQSRGITPWSHVVCLLFAQLAHSLSLYDLVDALRIHASSLVGIRGAKPPSRSGLSYANRERNAEMAKDLFWAVLEYLDRQDKNFIPNGPPKRCSRKKGRHYLPQRFTRTIHAIDSTTIRLVANCMDWAKHRRRKAAAKAHVSLNLNSFLPSMVIVKAAKTHDATEAPMLCAHVKAGEIVVFDRAYVDFKHLHALDQRGVFWVTRGKRNMASSVIGEVKPPKGKILRDVSIQLTTAKSAAVYGDAPCD